MEKIGLGIGVIGGIGLGLLLGAILVVISLVTMGFFSYKGKK